MSPRADWLLKALYESAGELRGRLLSVGEHVAQRHPLTDEPSMLELAGRVRDRERITLFHLEQLVLSAPARLKLHDLEWLEPERRYENEDLSGLTREYVAQRRYTCGLLWDLSPREWERSATHPYMGTVSVEHLVVGLHEHDLEQMWRAGRIADALTAEERTSSR